MIPKIIESLDDIKPSKEYWQELKRESEDQIPLSRGKIKQCVGLIHQFLKNIELADEKLKEFPDDDPMPEELIDVVKEMGK